MGKKITSNTMHDLFQRIAEAMKADGHTVEVKDDNSGFTYGILIDGFMVDLREGRRSSGTHRLYFRTGLIHYSFRLKERRWATVNQKYSDGAYTLTVDIDSFKKKFSQHVAKMTEQREYDRKQKEAYAQRLLDVEALRKRIEQFKAEHSDLFDRYRKFAGVHAHAVEIDGAIKIRVTPMTFTSDQLAKVLRVLE